MELKEVLNGSDIYIDCNGMEQIYRISELLKKEGYRDVSNINISYSGTYCISVYGVCCEFQAMNHPGLDDSAARYDALQFLTTTL